MSGPKPTTINYVTRVRIPTLMLNGIYDDGIDELIKPAFELLGTPPEDKRLILYETDHIPPRAEYIKETLRVAGQVPGAGEIEQSIPP